MCNSCASLAGLVLCFIVCFILLVIAPLMKKLMQMSDDDVDVAQSQCGDEATTGTTDVDVEDVQSAVKSKACELFSFCDVEHKGVITKRDMQRLQQLLQLTTDELADVFDSLDDGGNGFITVHEFIDGFGRLSCHGRSAALLVEPAILFCCCRLETDHNCNKTCNKTYDKTENLKIIAQLLHSGCSPH